MKNLKTFYLVICLAFISPALFAQNEIDDEYYSKNVDIFSLLVPGDDSLSNLRKMIFDALHNSNEKQILADTLIKDSETAINVSEAILFKIYGKNNITRQKPYKTYLVDGYWILNGTLPEKMKGGTFLIIINSKNGQVIKLTHGK